MNAALMVPAVRVALFFALLGPDLSNAEKASVTASHFGLSVDEAMQCRALGLRACAAALDRITRDPPSLSTAWGEKRRTEGGFYYGDPRCAEETP